MTATALKTLYHRGRTGAIYSWRIWTEGADIVIEYGQIDGQKTIARRTAEAKNVGRTNETTPEQQATLEALSEHRHKLDRKYHDSLEGANTRKIAVMLAPNDKWNDSLKPSKSTKKYASYPADVQPKLDGNRCLAYWDGDRIVMMSRGQKEWMNLGHIVEQLEKIMPKDAMFDGELYVHGVPLQTIGSWIKKNRPETKQIKFHVYDIPVCDGEEKPWNERREDLIRLVPGKPFEGTPETPNVVLVPTVEVNSHEEVEACDATFREHGFEGSMVRLRSYMYEWGGRCRGLLKVKLFEDAEFKTVGWLEADGGHSGCVIWLCSTDPNQEIIGYVNEKPKNPPTLFKVVPNGTLEERKQWMQTAETFMGKLLTVKFMGYTIDGLPNIAKGVAFRLDEDLPLKASGTRKGKSGDRDDE